MKISERCAQNPAAVAAAAAIVLLFGVLALLRLPIQLLPGHAPAAALHQRRVARGRAVRDRGSDHRADRGGDARACPGLVEMRSESNRGGGGVGLTFEVGTDMTRVMLDVVSRLNTLPPLPPDAEEPQVFGGDNWQTENAGSLLVRPLPGHTVPGHRRGVPEADGGGRRAAARPCQRRVARQSRRRSPARSAGHVRSAPARGARYHPPAARRRPSSRRATCRPASPTSAAASSRCASPAASRSSSSAISSSAGARTARSICATSPTCASSTSRRAGSRSATACPAYYITLQRTSESNTVELIDGVKVAIEELNAGPLKENLLDRALVGRERLRAPRDRVRRGEPRDRHPARRRRPVVLPARTARAAA